MLYMLKPFAIIYPMLMSYLIHYNHHHQRSVLSFQLHATISRKIIRITPSPLTRANGVVALLQQQQQQFSVRCGGALLLNNNPTTAGQYQRNRLNVSQQLSLSTSSSSAAAVETTTLDEEADDTDDDTMTPTYPKFQNIAELHPVLKRNLEGMKLVTMTEIQSKTWEAASAGQDVLGRARTGTGKTVAFLLPAIQQLLLQNANVNVREQTKIQMLILSPTRELAAQIHDQALALTKRANDIISHQCMFGGSSKPGDIKMLEKQVPVILVATPGRLKDHIENTLIHDGKRSFKSLLSQVKILVLDETDRYVYIYKLIIDYA